MAFYYASEKNKRKENQDYYCHMEQRIDHDAVVESFLVADGMGGMADGKLYANQAVKIWYQELMNLLCSDRFRDCSVSKQLKALEEFSEDVFQLINQKLYRRSMDMGIRGGTTLSTVIHFWDNWIFANVGDSPIYYSDRKGFYLVSEIQNLASQLVKENKIESDSLAYFQNKNRLLEYLGKRESVHPHVQLVHNDQVKFMLMGSDGAFGKLSTSQLIDVIKSIKDPKNLLEELFSQVRNQGEEDNQTAILYVEDSLLPSFVQNIFNLNAEYEDHFKNRMADWLKMEKHVFGTDPTLPDEENFAGQRLEDQRAGADIFYEESMEAQFISLEEAEGMRHIRSHIKNIFRLKKG